MRCENRVFLRVQERGNGFRIAEFSQCRHGRNGDGLVFRCSQRNEFFRRRGHVSVAEGENDAGEFISLRLFQSAKQYLICLRTGNAFQFHAGILSGICVGRGQRGFQFTNGRGILRESGHREHRSKNEQNEEFFHDLSSPFRQAK